MKFTKRSIGVLQNTIDAVRNSKRIHSGMDQAPRGFSTGWIQLSAAHSEIAGVYSWQKIIMIDVIAG